MDWSEPYRQRAAEFASAIGIPSNRLPLFGDPVRNDLTHDMRYWISKLPDGYRLLWFEHGTAMYECDFPDVDEALYGFFCEYTEGVARHQVRSGKPTHRDERIPIGEIQVGLLAKASGEWSARRQRELAAEIAARTNK